MAERAVAVIITLVKHGRQPRDGVALVAHLAKTENVSAILAEVGNTIAATLSESVEVMEIYRASGGAAFFHATINPGKEISYENLMIAAHAVRLELDPLETRPYAIVIHEKPRAEAGGSRLHAHLVLSSADHTGKCLDDGWSIIRTERVARELEYLLGENPLVGRHHRPVLKALMNTKPEIFHWLREALGDDREKPESAFSSQTRNRARAQNLNLPKAKAAARAVWLGASTMTEFKLELEKLGFAIVAGKRPGVFVIVDQKGRLVGAANRILKLQRSTFNEMMESNYAGKIRFGDPVVEHAGSQTFRADEYTFEKVSNLGDDPRERNFGISGRAGPDFDHNGSADPDRSQRNTAARDPAGNPGDLGPNVGSFRKRRAIIHLRRIDRGLLKKMKEFTLTHAVTGSSEPGPTTWDGIVRTDTWGIVLLPKPSF
jgi:hypothetical protein